MVKHIFCIKTLFPQLFERAVKPIHSIPVFYDGHQVSTTSLDEKGEFSIVLPAAIETKIMKNRLRYLPLFEELNRNLDPSRIRLRNYRHSHQDLASINRS